jgi:aryl-alcohol dehydrogenase-like predicted oxidoreductase
MARERPLGMGCMRLSTESDRDEPRAIELLHTAFDSGIAFLDTADAYCLDDSETGHNERLIARALNSWNGERSRIIVATKGGLMRPGGEWIANGRARHLREACERSLRGLDVERIALYQLHAPDPKTPLATSVRALAALKDEGLIERIGLCNVTVGQIEAARRITDISAVQVELSVWHDENVLNGVVQYCGTHGIQLIAYRPLGGSRRVKRTLSDPVLNEIAERHGATAAEIALAWLADLSETIVTIPGPTRIETVRSIVRASTIQLTDEDRTRLDETFPSGQILRVRDHAPAAPRRDGEVVLIMGLPGAGKSTVARNYVDNGYVRLNRDEAGGSLRGLVSALKQSLTHGASRIVLDNTYVSRASRALVVNAAAESGLPVRCVWLTTSVEAAQVNAAWRMVSKYGRLLEPDEMRKTSRRDPNAFAPNAQFRHQRELEPPDRAEGFSQIDTLPFERTHDPALKNRALIVWCDDALATRGPALRRYQDEGWRLLGLAWRPQIAERTMTTEQVDAEFAQLKEQLGVAIEILYCPHAAGPPTCWCRKPLPGLGVVFIHRHQLDPSQCIYAGSSPQDQVFARRLDFQYRDASDVLN